MAPTTAETLKTNMRRVTYRVGFAIAKEMGLNFGLMFDGWTAGTRHYVTGFAVYHTASGAGERLIGLSPLDDGQTVNAHIEYIEAILAVYDKTTDTEKFLVGDNCSTNGSICTKLRVPLAGVRATRIFLLPGRSNATRWSSVWKMVSRYVRIQDTAHHVTVVGDLMPRGSEHRRILAIHEKVKEPNSECEKLQHHERTLSEVRGLIYACVEKYPVMGEHLKADADIVHSKAL
ncbi:hypothetical protein BBJ28_00000275 [Nothophytophthora sp. Chile5]|nr:hypothetical protein BBJ28_00000275 [Nothophytophthora sp. Chile5]